MSGTELAVAVRVLSQPLIDLYNVGKDRFDAQLQKWRNAASRKALAQRVTAIQKVKPFWQRDKEVSIASFYYPNRIRFAEVTKSVSTLKDFGPSGNFVIEGTVGQGKSIFLRYLCVQELKDSGSGRIPVFIELRTLREDGLRSAIYSALDRLGFTVDAELFDFYCESGKLVLLLDAFDELDESLVKDVISDLEALSEKFPPLQIFVTSRPHSAIQDSRHFRVLYLARLEPQDHEPFIRRIGVRGDDVARLMSAIKDSSTEVSGLLTTPLMLTLFVIVYRAEHAIPKELPDFFDTLFQTLFTKHDKSKPGFERNQKSGLGERALQQLFQAFCFCAIQLKQTTTLTSETFHKTLDMAFNHTGTICSHEGFQHDITKVTCLIQEEGFAFHFIHKSVMEFYAASFVRSFTDELAQKFYSQLVPIEAWGQYRRWQQVLQFLSNIDRYRYNRYFAIPTIACSLAYLGIPPPYDEKNIPSNLIDLLYQEVTFEFDENKDGHWQQGAIGPFKSIRNLEQAPMFIGPNLRIVSAIFDSEEDIRAAYPTAKRDNRAISVFWKDGVSIQELAEIQEKAKSMVQGLIQKFHSLQKYVEDENDKTSLLNL